MSIQNRKYSELTVGDAINNSQFTEIVSEYLLARLEGDAPAAWHIRREPASGYKSSGDTVEVSRPLLPVVSFGPDTRPADTSELERVEVNLDGRYEIPINITDDHLNLDMAEFISEVIDPYLSVLTHRINKSVFESLYKGAYHYKDLTDVSTISNGMPEQRFRAVQITQVLHELREDSRGIKGFLTATALEMIDPDARLCDNQSVAEHTVGAYGSGTLRVDGAGQYFEIDHKSQVFLNNLDKQKLSLKGFPADANDVLNEGDIVHIGDIKKVSSYSRHGKKEVLESCMPFVVVSSGNNSDGSGECTVKIRPSIVIEGPRQNCSGAPADNAGVTVVGAAGSTRHENLFFGPGAHAFVLDVAINEVRTGVYRGKVRWGMRLLDGNCIVRVLTAQ